MALRPTTPPLNSLRAFEAVARLGSMKQAAQELSVTPGAVSQQVSNLEGILGIALFDRGAKLTLTVAGKAYFPALREALNQIEAATLDLVTYGGERSRLVIGALHTFSSSWIVPRLGRFQAEHPNIRPVIETLALNFATSERAPDVRGRRIDVGFYFGDGRWPGMVTHRIVGESLVVVAKPGFADATVAQDPAALVARYPRLVHTTRPRSWDDWALEQGIPVSGPDGPGFEHLYMVIEAARAGLGLALVPLEFVAPLVADGSLQQLSEAGARSRGSYYLFYSELRRDDPIVQAFRDWALQEAARAAAPDAGARET